MGETKRANLDAVDRRLVHRLSEALEPVLGSVAEDLDLSVAETQRRFDRLRQLGVVGTCTVKIDPASVGVGVTGFLLVKVAQNLENSQAIRTMFGDLDEVEEAHAVSGAFDWLLKVRSTSLEDLQQFVVDRLSLVPGFLRSETCVVLDTACDNINADIVTRAGLRNEQ